MKKHIKKCIFNIIILILCLVVLVVGYLIFRVCHPPRHTFKTSAVSIAKVVSNPTEISFEYFENVTPVYYPIITKYEYIIDGKILYLQFYGNYYGENSEITSNKIIIETLVEIQEIRICTSKKDYKTVWTSEEQ